MTEEVKVIDFTALYDQVYEEMTDEEADFEVGSFELAIEVGKRVGVKNPEKFAQTAASMIDDTNYFVDVLEKAYEITQIWEAE